MKLKLVAAFALFNLVVMHQAVALDVARPQEPLLTWQAAPQSAPAIKLASDGICGWYVILGCSRTHNGAWRTLNRLGGPGVGGWAGAQVVDTNNYPNFRNGWYCVADGPYPARWEAESIAWREAVRDAYVKAGC